MIKKGKVLILEDIIVDKSLPKHKIEVNEEEKDSNGFFLNPNSGDSGDSNWISRNDDPILEYLEYIHSNAPTIVTKAKIWVYRNIFLGISDRENKKLTPKEMNLFFESIKNSVREVDKGNIEEILSKYESLLNSAIKNNQIALVEKIQDYSAFLKDEIILSTSEFNKYITDKDLIKFYNLASVHEKYRTGLCLTYIKNFVKVIPEEVSKLKVKADELKVFDNYVILHYDYTGKSVKKTKAEIEKEKDPILFGVIKNSKNLYYIGDWIDEYCDLTLDVIIKKIGEVKEINSESIQKEMSRRINNT